MSSHARRRWDEEPNQTGETIDELLDAATAAASDRRRVELADLRVLVSPLTYDGDLSPETLKAWIGETGT